MAIYYKYHKYFLVAFVLMISVLWAGEEVKDTLINNNTNNEGKYWYIPPPVNVIHNSQCKFYGQMNGYYTYETLGVDCSYCGGLNQTIQRDSILPTNVDITIQSNIALPDIDSFVPVDKPARPKKQFYPHYPELARRLEQQGDVYVKMLIDLDGTVMKSIVIKSSGYPMLDSEAIATSKMWIFEPAQLNGKPTRVWVATPIKFALE